MTAYRLARRIAAVILAGSTLHTPGPSEDIGAAELDAVARHACDVNAEGIDPVGEILGTMYGYRLSVAVSVYAVETMCPELGIPVGEGAAIRPSDVRHLLRHGWQGDPADHAEILYPID